MNATVKAVRSGIPGDGGDQERDGDGDDHHQQ